MRARTVLLGLCASLAAPSAWATDTELVAALARLRIALGAYRPVEGRLSLDLPWAPFDPAGGGAPADPIGMVRAAAEIEALAARGETAQRLAALGVLRIAERRADAAVPLLERAVELSPQNAGAWSDLAAARLAMLDRAPELRPRALEAAELAMKLDPGGRAPRFAGALALAAFGLVGAARTEWASLASEPDTAWSTEIRKRMDSAAALERDSAEQLRDAVAAALESRAPPAELRALVERDPDVVGRIARDEWLPRWGRLRLEGRDAEAAALLHVLRGVGQSLWQLQGDALVRDSVDAIERAADTGRRRAIAEGLRAYGDAQAPYAVFDIAKAQPLFETAARILDAHPMGRAAAFYRALGVYWRSEFAPALAEFERLRATESERHPILRAQETRMCGLMRIILGKPLEAAADYRAALRLVEGRRAREAETMLQVLLADVEGSFRNETGSWRLLGEALGRVPVLEPLRQRYVLDSAEDYCERASQWRAAARLAGQLVSLSRRSGSPALVADALLREAQVAHVLGRTENAAEVLDEAQRTLASIPDAQVRARYEAEVRLSDGLIHAADDPDRASVVLRESFDFFEARRHTRAAPAALELGRVEQRAGRLAEAEAWMTRAVEVWERHARDAGSGPLGPQDFEQMQDAFEGLVALTIAHGDDAAAFAWSERSRAARLLSQEAAQLPTADRAFDWPFDATLLEYFLLPDRVVAFVVSGEGAAPRQVAWSASRAKIEDTVAKLRMAQAKGSAGVEELARQLGKALLDPVQPFVAPGRPLVIVPHRALFDVGFGSLVDASGRPLIERNPVSMLPSARLGVLYASRAAARTEPRALAVAATVFDRDLLPASAPLTNAEFEASRVRDLYRDAALLIGQNATPESFLDALPKADVVHLAGHAIANRDEPGSSALLLAPTEGDTGIVYARDIEKMRLPLAPVVVLSGCETGGGLGASSEGVGSLARAFLVAGARAVIASLAPVVDDADTVALVARLHEGLARGDDAAEALRAAQRASPRGPVSVQPTWSAFVLYGPPRGKKTGRTSIAEKESR